MHALFFLLHSTNDPSMSIGYLEIQHTQKKMKVESNITNDNISNEILPSEFEEDVYKTLHPQLK